MAVQNDLEAALSGARDDAVQQAQAMQPLQVGVQLVIDVVGQAFGVVEKLIAERQTNGVKTGLRDLIEHALPVAGIQPVRREGVCLHPKPVYAGQSDLVAARIDYFTLPGVQESI